MWMGTELFAPQDEPHEEDVGEQATAEDDDVPDAHVTGTIHQPEPKSSNKRLAADTRGHVRKEKPSPGRVGTPEQVCLSSDWCVQ